MPNASKAENWRNAMRRSVMPNWTLDAFAVVARKAPEGGNGLD